MTYNHTPSPWVVCHSEKPTFISHTTGVYSQPDSSDERIIALCDEDLLLSSDEQLSNARLIAAAPELLEALQELEQRLDYSKSGPFSHYDSLECLGIARAAIAKARGES
jgi:hypothetical protein